MGRMPPSGEAGAPGRCHLGQRQVGLSGQAPSDALHSTRAALTHGGRGATGACACAYAYASDALTTFHTSRSHPRRARRHRCMCMLFTSAQPSSSSSICICACIHIRTCRCGACSSPRPTSRPLTLIWQVRRMLLTSANLSAAPWGYARDGALEIRNFELGVSIACACIHMHMHIHIHRHSRYVTSSSA